MGSGFIRWWRGSSSTDIIAPQKYTESFATLGYHTVSLETVINLLAQHGYRDQYPRRDAVSPDALFYVFVKDGYRRLGIRSVRGKVRLLHFEKLKQVVLQDEDDPKNF